MKQILNFSLILFLLISCTKKDKEKERFNILNPVSNIELNDSVYRLIENYMNKYPQFETFLLVCAPKSNQISSDEGYLLGPAYEGMNENGSPIFYITIDNKQIFIKLGIETLIKVSDVQNSVFTEKMIPRGIDSLVIPPNWTIKNGSELYIHRAIFFSMHNEHLYINNRPDSIFAPQLKEIIQFENIKEIKK